MKAISLRSAAKINLTLDILGKDEVRGKHFVNTILYRDDNLYDELELEESGFENELVCHTPGVPLSEHNTVLKALELLGINGWRVTIHKKIPMQAGLGGGSSNAGAVLKYFGRKKGIPEHNLLEIAQKIGADVPFFILDDNLAYFEGFGDHFVQSWRIEPLKIEYLPTGINTPTAEAYSKLDLKECGQNSAETELLVKIFNEHQGSLDYSLLTTHYSLIHNDFEASFFSNYPAWEGKGNLCGSGGWLWRMGGLG